MPDGRVNSRAAGKDAAAASSKAKSGETVSSSSNTPRKRVSQACDRCRSRKDKCDGKKPVCSPCAALDQVCSYDPSTKKRGLPEGYVRGLEKLWGLTIREALGVEDIVLSTLHKEPETLAQIWNDPDIPLWETWRKSTIYQELDRLLPLLELAEDRTGKRKRPEGGRGLEGSAGLDSNAKVDGIQPTIVTSNSTANGLGGSAFLFPFHLDHLAEAIRRNGDEGRFSERSVKVAELDKTVTELPSRAWHLLDVYFSYTHCWLPIVEKHDLLRTSYQYSQALNISSSSTGSGDHSALWAILAYADHQDKAMQSSRDSPTPQADQWTVEALYEHARELIPTEDGPFELGHVQALLILTLFNMGQGHWSRAWMLVGQAVRIAIELNLAEVRQPPPTPSNTGNKKSRSKHVFLGCFALDTLVSARLDRCPHLRSDDIEQVGLVEEDGLDEWDPWMDSLGVRRQHTDGPRGPVSVLSTFNRLIQVLKIQNAITSSTSTGAPALKDFTSLIEALNKCPHIPPQFNTSSTKLAKQTGTPLLPHHYHLYLARVCASIALGNSSDQPTNQLLSLLTGHLGDFGMSLIPPTIDCFLKISDFRDVITNGVSRSDNAELSIQQVIIGMSKAWPTFNNYLMNELEIFSPQNPTVAASDFMILGAAPSTRSYMMPANDTPISIMDSNVDHDEKQLVGQKSEASDLLGDLAFTPSGRSVFYPFGQFSLQGHSPAPGHDLSIDTPVWSKPSPGLNMSLGPSDYLQHRGTGSMSSEVDGDSMFNEFATLDAMEWTNNWDQSLLNLGFTDPDNMNQDFYAFCREPDPLYSNNLVQQLLSNQDIQPNAISMDNSFLGFSNSHVEASQILQALSSGEDRAKLPS